ncbi:hypothetical protein EJ08DRAFT_424062 [Tothia fuscella]|uniref:Uncharacterized protein n=1 Tax=Tothia fuscella TaxID=1048955 RepID=A0A9P4NJT4_9PEZI|nr:hypothetical protein EJ08DRAFT_424062 [Tothia fuscella]
MVDITTISGGLDTFTPPTPIAARIVFIVISVITQFALAYCIIHFTYRVSNWRNLPFIMWLTFAIYIDSFLFASATAILSQGISISRSIHTCESAIFLCLIFYFGTKINRNLYFAEKVYLVRGLLKRRLQDRLYLFNTFGLLLPYGVLAVLSIVHRTKVMKKRNCYIGVDRKVLGIVVSFEIIVNVYLTVLFLKPLTALYSYKLKSKPALRAMALRTFVGSCATMVFTAANLVIMIILGSELGYLFLIICNLDSKYDWIIDNVRER